MELLRYLYSFVQIGCIVVTAPVFALLLVLACKTNIYLFIHIMLPQLRASQPHVHNHSAAALFSITTVDEWLTCILMLIPCAVVLKWALVFWLDTFSFSEEIPALQNTVSQFRKEIAHLSPETRRPIELLVLGVLVAVAYSATTLVDLLKLEELSRDTAIITIPLQLYLRSVIIAEVGLGFLLWSSRALSQRGQPATAPRHQNGSVAEYAVIVKTFAIVSAIAYGIYRGTEGPIHVAAWALVVGSLLSAIYLGCWLVFVLFTEILLSNKRTYIFLSPSFWSMVVGISLTVGLLGKSRLESVGRVVVAIAGVFVVSFQLAKKYMLRRSPSSTPVVPPQTVSHEDAASEKTSYLSVLASLVIYALVIFTFLLVVMVYAQESNLETTYSCSALSSWTRAVMPAAELLPSGPIQYDYEICNRVWHDLNIIDLGLLADMAYWKGLQNEPCFQETFSTEFNALFESKDWVLRGQSETNANVGFYDLYSKSRNLSVVSIRGTTSRTLDLLEDADLFMEIALLQAVSFIVPVVQLSPDGLVANMVKLASLPEQWLTNSKRYYYQPVLDYVESSCRDRNILLTGHSLGGAIATIVAAKTNHVAVTFSPPGLVYSRRKFGIHLADLEKYSISVLPARDPVTMIDKHTGSVQHISCFESNPFACHSLRRTICDLHRKCRGSKPLFCPRDKS